MYAYEGPFSREEVQAWLDKMLTRYKQEGVALYAVCLKETGRMIGQCGLIMQDIPGSRVLEVGYLFEKPTGTGAIAGRPPPAAWPMPLKNWAPGRYMPLSGTATFLLKTWPGLLA